MKKVDYKEILALHHPELEYLGRVVENKRTKLIVKSKYGKNYIYPTNIHKKQSLTIESSLDKTEYFINWANDVHNSFYNYSLSVYTSHNSKIKIICPKHGLFVQETNSHLQGHGCSKCVQEKTTQRPKLCKNDELKRLHISLKIEKECYSSKDSIIINTVYGQCKMTVYSLLKGNKPSIKSAINKTSYLINQAKEIHGNKYDYSFTKYSSKRLIKIKCSQHGIFKQDYSSHLSGYGCKFCSYDNSGWTHSKWIERGSKSKNFDSYKVYIIRCWNEHEEFYKIGKTFTKLETRFKEIPYAIEVVKVITGKGLKISSLERSLQRDNKTFKYLPKINFGGRYECFSKIKNLEL